MPGWSGTSCCHWIGRFRPPDSPASSPYGVFPAITTTPARSRSTLCTIAPRFSVPESTCTKIACGRPVIFQ